MKNLVLYVLLFSLSFVTAQDNPVMGAPTNNLGLNAADEGMMVYNALDLSKISGVFYEFDDIRFSKVKTDGSYFLFEDWKNKGEILYGGKKLIIFNINYNVKSEEFMSQMESDSTFIFDFKGIDKIIVNNRPFKRFYNTEIGENKVYEILYESQDLSLLKNFFITVVESSPNPMLNRNRNKINKQSSYFVSKNGLVSSFKLRKSDILGLSTNNQKELEMFVKDNKLSYNKEGDVVKIFEYLSRN